jgi:hypothetical protein
MPYKGTSTSTAYFMAAERLASRKVDMMSAYKGRSMGRGAPSYVLNVEELATLWHFPIDAVTKAPLLQRANARRIEAPMSLPTTETELPTAMQENIFSPGFKVEPPKPAPVQQEKAFSDFLAAEIQQEEKIEESAADMPPGNLPFVD